MVPVWAMFVAKNVYVCVIVAKQSATVMNHANGD